MGRASTPRGLRGIEALLALGERELHAARDAPGARVVVHGALEPLQELAAPARRHRLERLEHALVVERLREVRRRVPHGRLLVDAEPDGDAVSEGRARRLAHLGVHPEAVAAALHGDERRAEGRAVDGADDGHRAALAERAARRRGQVNRVEGRDANNLRVELDVRLARGHGPSGLSRRR